MASFRDSVGSNREMTPTLTARRRRRSTISSEFRNNQKRGSARIQTFSNYLGVLNAADAHTIHANGRPRAPQTSSYYSASPGYPGARNFHSQLQTYTIEGGWMEGVDGRLSYVEHGRIEELDDDHAYKDDYDNNDGTTAPRPLPSLHTPADTTGVRRNTFGIPITEPLPPSTTPPPCPRPERIHRQLSPWSTGGVDYSRSAMNAFPFIPAKDILSSPPAVLDTLSEIALLQENLNLLNTVLQDLQIMCTCFFAQRPVESFSGHIESCSRIEESVHSILEILTRRLRLGEEEWHVRSTSWHQKYSKRLYSLKRTLLRLASMRRLIEARNLKPHQITLILAKLAEHDLKTGDLAKKFTAAFDRLRLRHLHFLLTQAHDEAQRKQETRRIDEVSFERRWNEHKAMRAGLRQEFHAYRTGRQPSAQ